MNSGLTDVKLHRQIVEALVAEHERSAPPTDPQRRPVLGCAWGLYAQVYRHARAVLLLTDATMEHEAHLHVRAALEHAVMLHWVVERGDAGVEAMLASQEKQVKRSVKTARVAELKLPAEVEREIAAAGPPLDASKAYGTFRDVCEQISVLSLYFVYGVESQFVHPSLMTINAYCDPSKGPGREVLTNAPRAGDHHQHSFYLLAQSLIWSCRDLERLVPDPDKAAGLEALAVQIEAVRTLPPYTAPDEEAAAGKHQARIGQPPKGSARS